MRKGKQNGTFHIALEAAQVREKSVVRSLTTRPSNPSINPPHGRRSTETGVRTWCTTRSPRGCVLSGFGQTPVASNTSCGTLLRKLNRGLLVLRPPSRVALLAGVLGPGLPFASPCTPPYPHTPSPTQHRQGPRLHLLVVPA